MDKTQYKEVWIKTDDGQSMCALINGNNGWLMYLRFNGDAGFSSRNPDYDGDQNAMMDFCLNNGQLDEYPLSWVLPIHMVERALAFFEKEHRPPTFITWHNDSSEELAIKEK